MYVADLITEFEAAAFAVDFEGQAVAAGDIEREPTLLAEDPSSESGVYLCVFWWAVEDLNLRPLPCQG